MATRFYGTTALSPLQSIAIDGAWVSINQGRYVLKTFKDSNTDDNVQPGGGTANANFCAAQFVSAPLKGAQTISGYVKGVMRCNEANATYDLCPQIVIRVVSNDGTTVRGTLIAADNSALSNEFNTSVQNRKFPRNWSGQGAALTSVSAQDGDRIVVEIGCRSFATNTGSALYFASNATTDCAENETDTAAYAGWLEFSQTLDFGSFPQVHDSDTKNGTQTSNSNSWTLTYPTNLESGDLILYVMATDGSVVVNQQAGFVTSWQSSGANTLIWGKKVSDGTETGTFTIGLSGSEQGGWRVFRITGWNGTIGSTFDNTSDTGDVARVSTVTGSPSANPNPPSLDPANWNTEDTLWLAVCSADTSRTISVYPLGDRKTADVSGGSTGATLGVCSTNSAVASLDPGTFTISSSDDWVAATIAIRPAPSGPPLQTLSPGGISSAEAFGSSTVTPGTATLSPSGIGTGQAFGSPTVIPAAITLSPSGIGSGEAFGSPAVSVITRLSPSAIGSGQAFGSPTVTPGAVTLSPSGISSGESFGSPGLTSTLTVSPSAISSGQAFGNVTITPGQLTLSPGGIASLEAFGSATITPGTATLSPSGIASAGAFGNPTISLGVITLSPSGIISGEALGSPGISASVRVSPSGIISGEAFGTPNIAGGRWDLAPSGIPSAEAFGNATVQIGVTSISPAAIVSAEAFGTPAVQPGAITVSPSGIGTGQALGTPGLALSITISPSGIASLEAFGSPGLSTHVTLSPGGILSGEAFGSPLLSTGSELVPAGIPSGEAFGQAQILPGAATVSPSAIVSIEAFGTPGLVPGVATVSPTGIASAEVFGDPRLSGANQIVPFAIPSEEAFGMVQIIPEVTLFAFGIASLETFGDPAIQKFAPIPTRTYTTSVARAVEFQTSVTRAAEYSVRVVPTEEIEVGFGED